MIDKEFLINYFPANEFFTTRSEMNLIIEKLNLQYKTKDELHKIRNEVVNFYHDYLNKDQSFMDAMMSITTVIDHIIYTGQYVVA